MRPETVKAVVEKRVPKGDALEGSKISAIQAAKNTPLFLPYCHPLPIEGVWVEFDVQKDAIAIEVRVKTTAKTGVEMEALVAATAAALNLYDMLKMLDDTMVVESVSLLRKEGGKTGPLQRAASSRIGIAGGGAAADLVRSRLNELGLEAIQSNDVDLLFQIGLPPTGHVTDEDIEMTVRSHVLGQSPFAKASEFRAGWTGSQLVLVLPDDPILAGLCLDALLPQVFDLVGGKL